MAVNIKDMVTNTRDLLGLPNHQDLPLYRVLLRMQRVIDHYRNRMNITDVDWILNTWRLAVDPFTDTFVVSAPSWGRPVLITSVSDAGTQIRVSSNIRIRYATYLMRTCFMSGRHKRRRRRCLRPM